MKRSDETSNAHSHINKEVGMNSITEVKKGIGRGLAAMALVAAVLAVPSKAAIIAGGSVPLENYFVAVGYDGLDVRAVGTLATLATIYITNNAPNSFSLVVTVAYGGFKRLGSAAGVPVVATGLGNPFTAIEIIDASAGHSLASETMSFGAALATTPIVPGLAASNAAWVPGAQAEASVDYGVDVNATWAAAPTLLAGYYHETITVALTAVM